MHVELFGDAVGVPFAMLQKLYQPLASTDACIDRD
jgi:hypothetical protein